VGRNRIRLHPRRRGDRRRIDDLQPDQRSDARLALEAKLLRNEDVTNYNALRQNSSFLTFNLSQRDLSGLDLRSADFSGAELTGTNFSGCNLQDARFWLAEMPRSNLKDADVTRVTFSRAILSSAILTGIHGEAPDFSEAIMVDVSLTRLDGLRLANFADADLAEANLFDSSSSTRAFPKLGSTAPTSRWPRR
jgi:uncharacterized protein YjbI with pentapeptide repeats